MASLHHTFSEQHREAVFSQLAQQIGGTFTNEEGWRNDRITVSSGPWTIVLDVYGEPGWKMEQHFTRLRAPFINADRLRFHIYREGLADRVATMLGLQDIQTGDGALDDAYIIQSNNPEQVKRLLSNPTIRAELLDLRDVDLSIRDHEGDLGPLFPPGVDELQLRIPGVIGRVEELREAYDLFAEVLRTLTHIGSAYDRDPNLKL